MFKDITGIKYGKLTAVRPVSKDKDGSWIWLFNCECGGIKTTRGVSVRNGSTQSCGCALFGHSPSEETREKMRQAKLGKPGPWLGKKRPEVLGWLPVYQKGHVSWLKGKKNPHFTGPNNPKWVSDRSKLVKNESKHLDSQYKVWMTSVKNRDGWKCRISNGSCSGRLEAHHILRWSEHPELRYQINNGITLCHFHHPIKKSEEVRLSPYFQELVGKANYFG